MCLSVRPVHMFVYHMCVCVWCLWWPDNPLKLELLTIASFLYGAGNLGSLSSAREEVLLTSEPSTQLWS